MAKSVRIIRSNSPQRYRLAPHRRSVYAQLIGHRLPTPLAVVERNTFHLWRDGTTFSWKVPWRVPGGIRLILKMEHLAAYNPSGSCYDRLYPYLFHQLERRGWIAPGPNGTPIIECSAGNAGAAFCDVAARLGYRNRTLIIPEDIYPARIDQVRSYGGRTLFSPKDKGEFGYIEMIENVLRQDALGKGKIGLDRSRLVPVTNTFCVPNEPYARLVEEVYQGLVALGFPPVIDVFMFGVGAGNTISQVSKAIRARQTAPLDVKVLEFAECPFVAAIKDGRTPPASGGWPLGDMGGTIYGVPLEKLNLDLRVIDDVVTLNASERDEGRAIANEALGLCAGRPTGMGPAALLKMARRRDCRGKQIFGIVFDSIAKYETQYDEILDVDFQRGQPIRASDTWRWRKAV